MKTLGRVIIMCVSIFVDLLKLFFFYGFLGIGTALNSLTPVGGGVVGALAGCYINSSHTFDIIGCAVGALGGGAIGVIAGTIGAPVGSILGEIADFCIGLLGGSGLLWLYFYNDMFYPTTVFGGFTANLLPGINVLPFEWTITSAMCIMRKMSEEGSVLASTVGAGVALAQGNVTSAVQNASKAVGAVTSNDGPAENDSPIAANDNQPTQPHVAPELKNVEGVRRPAVPKAA